METKKPDSTELETAVGDIKNGDGIEMLSMEEPIDPVKEKKLLLKIDLHLIPILCLLLLCAFLDR